MSSPAPPTPPSKPGIFRRYWPRFCAGGYLLLLVVAASLARLVAKRHWAGTMLLYLPQGMYLAPWPLLFLGAWWRRERIAAALLLSTLGVIVGPIMGFQTPNVRKGSRQGTARFLRKYLPRYKLRVVVRSPLGHIRIAGVHFHTKSPRGPALQEPRKHFDDGARVRLKEAQSLVDWLTGVDEPLILAGDFNTPPRGRVYGKLTRSYADAFAQVGFGWGHTFPAALPLLRIDYIFHSRHWNTVSCRTGGAEGSDHLPVVAESSLRSAGGGGARATE